MMKRRVLCIFSLVAYLTAACMLLNGVVEKQMTIPVTVFTAKASTKTGQNIEIGVSRCFDGGNPYDLDSFYLSEVREGTGWQSGLRCYTVEDALMDPGRQCFSFFSTRDYDIITGAGRDPLDGDLAQIIKPETITDTLLYTYSTNYGLPDLTTIPSYMELLASHSHAVLVQTTKGTLPLLPNVSRNLCDGFAVSDRVFSLTEAEQFLQQMPAVAVVCCVFLVGILFWALGCLISRQRFPWLCLLGAAGALLAMCFALQAIDLPASMLPNTNIFDIAHYREEFTLIFDSLRELGLSDYPLFSTAAQARVQCRQVGFLTALVCAGILAREVIGWILASKRRKRVNV